MSKVTPRDREEKLLAAIAEGATGELPTPRNRKEKLLKEIYDNGGTGGGGGESTIAWRPTVDAEGNISWERTASTVKPATQNIKGPRGEKGDPGEANVIESISVNGTPTSIDENKNVDITVPEAYDDTDIRTELAKKADATSIPSKVSELTNDSNYQTAEQVNSTVTTEIAKVVADAPEDLNTLKEMSDWIAGHENDASAMNSAISDNKTAITALQTGKADKNEIPTTVAELTDSADYAKKTDLHSHDNKSVLDGITSDKVTYWDNKSEFSGSYNDLNDKPTIDAELSNTSENAIQNKVVTKEINKLYSDISFNDFDTATSGTSFTDAEDGNILVTDWTKNLLNPTLATTTENGVTCTNNGDGTYTLNGTATEQVAFWINFNNYLDISKLDAETDYKIICTPYGGKDNTYRTDFRINETLFGSEYAEISRVYKGKNFDISGYLVIVIRPGYTCDNLVFKPMITTNLNATYDDFVPYGGYQIQSCGKNLLNPTLQSTTQNGVTCTNNGDGTYTLNGTNTNTITYFDMIDRYTPSSFKIYETVRFLGIDSNSSDVKISFSFNSGDGTIVEKKISSGYVDISVPENTKCMFSYIQVESGAVLNNVIIKPMLTTDLSTTAADFEPYTGETITVTNETEYPAFGLKSHKGITHIISPANVKCVYPTNESGKGVLDSLYNKDKMLTEQNDSLSVIGKCKNLLNPTLQTTTQDGITCTNNGDGTYTFNGTATNNVFFDINNNISINKGTKYKIISFKDEDYVPNKIMTGLRRIDTVDTYVDDNGSFVADSKNCWLWVKINKGFTVSNLVAKPMLTTNLSATYDDFVPYTGDGETLASDVAELRKDLGGLTFSASGTTLTITDGTNTWTLEANS